MRLRTHLAILGLGLVVLAGCGEDEPADRPATTSAPPDATAVRVVALGDSETTGAGDPTGLGWVGRYVRLLGSELGIETELTNLAMDGKTSAELLSDVRDDPRTREAIESAQVVLLGIGGADYNAGDDAFAAGTCRAEACYAPGLKAFADNFEATVAAIRDVRGDEPTAIRAITEPNPYVGAEDVIPPFLVPVAARVGVYQARKANRAICRTMAAHDGACIDVLRPFNGPDGTDDAYAKGLLNHTDCCYPSAKGQQLMAELLVKTGLAPVQ